MSAAHGSVILTPEEEEELAQLKAAVNNLSVPEALKIEDAGELALLLDTSILSTSESLVKADASLVVDTTIPDETFDKILRDLKSHQLTKQQIAAITKVLMIEEQDPTKWQLALKQLKKTSKIATKAIIGFNIFAMAISDEKFDAVKGIYISCVAAGVDVKAFWQLYKLFNQITKLDPADITQKNIGLFLVTGLLMAAIIRIAVLSAKQLHAKAQKIFSTPHT